MSQLATPRVPTRLPSPSEDTRANMAAYLKGFGLALLLTLLGFGLVAAGTLPKSLVLPLIFLLGLVQILVHVRYLLHLDITPENQPYLLMISSTFLMLLTLVGGALWILYDLHMLTMPQ